MKTQSLIMTALMTSVALMPPSQVRADNAKHQSPPARVDRAPRQSVEGTRGGGKAVFDGTHFELPDLLDPTACDWVTGDDLLDGTLDGLDIQPVQQIKPTLSRIAALDWYFALDLERQIRSLRFCFTRFLKPFITEDDPRFRHMTPVYFSNQVQAGVRDGGFVFVERDIYNGTGVYKDKGMLAATRVSFIIHETMHSYVDMNDRLHNTHVKTMVAALHKVDTGDIRSRRLLHAAMQGNALQFPLNVDSLDSDRDFLTFLFEDEKARRERILDGDDLSPILNPPRYPAQSLMLAEDAAVLENAERDLVDTALGGFCETVDRPVITRITDDPAESSLDLATVCLSTLGSRVTESDYAFLMSRVNHTQRVDQFFSDLAAKQAQSREGRILVSAATAWLSESGTDSRKNLPAIELRPVTSDSFTEISSYSRAFTEMLVLMAQHGQIDQAIAMTAGDQRFYAAFTLLPLLKQIDAINPYIPREKPLAKQGLINVFTAYWSETLRQVSGAGGAAAASRLAGSLDPSKLGYAVSVPADAPDGGVLPQTVTNYSNYSNNSY